MSTRPPWEVYAEAAAPTTPAGADSRPPWEVYAAAAPQAEESSPSLADRWNAAAPRRAGAVKSVLNTLTGVYDLGSTIVDRTMPNIGTNQPEMNLTDLMMGRTAPQGPMSARQVLAEDITPTPEEEGGYLAGNIAQFLAPTPAGKGALAAAAINAGQSGLLTHLQGGTGGDTAQSAAIGAAGPLVAAAGKALSPALRRLAETQYGRALNATTSRLKDQSKRIVPELLNRRVTGSLETLAAKGAEESATAGRSLQRAYESASNAGVQSGTAPIINGLEKVKQRFFATSNAGVQIAVNPGAVAKVEAIQKLVGEFGPSARPDQLWAMRKNIDDIIEASGGFTGPLTPGTTKTLQREARTAIQKELNKAAPNIEALNAEFSLWKGLEDISKATIKRKEGQSGIVEIVGRAGIGSGLGLLLGEGDPKWSVVGGLLGSVTKSPHYRTVAASEKARLAHALAMGQADTAAAMLSRILAGFSTTAGSGQSATSRP